MIQKHGSIAMEVKKLQRSYPTESHLARWASIKRLLLIEINKLHEIERKAWLNECEKANSRQLIDDESDWRLQGDNFMIRINTRYGAFWPLRSDVSWRNDELKKFQSHIYPIWRPIWNRHDESSMLLPGEEGYFGEIDSVHLIDTKIHKDNYNFPPRKMQKSGEIDNDPLKE